MLLETVKWLCWSISCHNHHQKVSFRQNFSRLLSDASILERWVYPLYTGARVTLPPTTTL
jgi:hypothetical protein